MDFAAHYEVAHRCPACWAELEHLSTNDEPEAIADGVFAVCKMCGHIYWVNLARGEIRNLDKAEKAMMAAELRAGNPMAFQMRDFQREVARRICPND